MKLKSCEGITILELVIVLAILGLLVASAGPIYTRLQTSSQVSTAVSTVMLTLRKAQIRAESRVNNSQHGVHVTTNIVGQDSITLYQGASYATRDVAYDEVTTYPEVLNLTTTLTGNDINFSRSKGVPDNTGSITITHIYTGSVTISINALGRVEQN